MIESPFESPALVILAGILAAAALGVVYFQTRRVAALAGLVGVGVLVVLGFAIEIWVVTEREEVEATLDGVAAALEHNDAEEVVSYLSETAVQTRSRVAEALAEVQINKINIRNLRITVNRFTSPPSAEASFDGTAFYDVRRMSIDRGTYLARFVVKLRREDGRWRITDHIEHEPFGR